MERQTSVFVTNFPYEKFYLSDLKELFLDVFLGQFFKSIAAHKILMFGLFS